MEELYQQRYGVPGTVLYPARACDATTFDQPPERLAGPRESLVCGYAGSINSPGYMRALRDMANALTSVNGTLLVFGPVTKEAAAAQGLDQPNIRWEGMVSSNELIRRLRAEADFLFAPMSFDERDRYNMEISFPSKLTDYTAMGLPLLIYGPPYASAVRWAEENPGSAVVLTSENVEDMHAALKRLCHDSPWRTELAQGAVSAGARWLSHEAGQRVFESALLAASPGRQSI
jgi:glycosyltransferase involved in cell wall biosynthesis